MIRVFVDTNAYVEFKRGNPHVLEVFHNSDEIVLSSIVLGELLAGFSIGTQEGRNRQELMQFLASDRVKIASIDDITAEAYARLYAALRHKGKPIPTNDMWIASGALQLNAPLLTFDKHFLEIHGLRIVASLSDINNL